MYRGIRQVVAAGALAFASPYALAGSHGPSMFGGVSFEERADHIVGPGNSFQASIYTAVFAGVGSPMPSDPLLYAVTQGESVFVYLVENTGSYGNIDLFTVMNPSQNGVNLVGYGQFAVSGWDENTRVLPAVLYGGKTHVEWQFKSSFDGVLMPGEWTVLIARSIGGWQENTSWVGSFSTGFASPKLLGPGPAIEVPAYNPDNGSSGGGSDSTPAGGGSGGAGDQSGDEGSADQSSSGAPSSKPSKVSTAPEDQKVRKSTPGRKLRNRIGNSQK